MNTAEYHEILLQLVLKQFGQQKPSCSSRTPNIFQRVYEELFEANTGTVISHFCL